MERSEEPALPLRLMTVLVVVGTFLAGAAAGVGFDRWSPGHRHHHPPPPMGLPLAELDLTPEQDAAAYKIIESHRAELDAIVSETFPRVRAVHEQVEREIRPLLTPEQQHKLDEWKARRPPPPPFGQHGFHGPRQMGDRPPPPPDSPEQFAPPPPR